MIIILGGNGHIGSKLAKILLAQNEKVTVVLHSSDKEKYWQDKGAVVSVTDVLDEISLREVFKTGERLFLLNPPAAPSTDTVAGERKTVHSILNAIDGSPLQKVVAQSTYGAQPGDSLGDLGVLYEMEQELAKKSLPVTIIRGAYYMSNWDMALDSATKEGVVHTLYPVNFKLPMVAAADIAQLAAQLITEPVENTGICSIEGPEHYSSSDVANAFAKALNKPVKAVETPQDQWTSTLKKMGFSDVAADSFVNMTETAIYDTSHTPLNPVKGEIALETYISDLVNIS